jgi:hypothetical protein
MRVWIIAGVAALVAAAPGHAAVGFELRGAAARIVVVPEARSDVSVVLLKTNPRLPLRTRSIGGRIVMTGDVNRRVRSCGTAGASRELTFWGRGSVPYDALPLLVVRTPLAVRVSVSDAVFGVMGRSASVDFTNQGCGDWTLANVRGRLRLDQAGSGESRVGTAASADLSVAGSGRIATAGVSGALTAISSGSGDVTVAKASGSVDVRVAGTGTVDILSGHVAHMAVSIAGSGDVRLAGTAQSLDASVTGSGDVVVRAVKGQVLRHVFGAGAVRIGP